MKILKGVKPHDRNYPQFLVVLNREHYIAARGYEFYPREILSAREDEIRIPKRPRHVLFMF